MIGFYHCDVGLIVPLKEEFDQLHQIAAIEDQYRIGDRAYSHIRFDSLEIWATCVGEMGNAPAMQCAQEFIDLLKPRLLICVGIGGSLNRKDIRLGDVAVSRWVKDISDAAKVEDKDDTYIIKMVGRSFHGDERLVSILENLSPEDYRDWRITCAERMRLCALSDTQKRIGSDWPRVHVKGFASGFVLASDRFQVTETDRELGIAETEGAGVGRAAERQRAPFLIVRGVSDYADPKKSALEQNSRNIFRSLSAANALSFALHILALPAIGAYVSGLVRREGFVAWPVAAAHPQEARKFISAIVNNTPTPTGKSYHLRFLDPYDMRRINGIVSSLEPSASMENDKDAIILLVNLVSHFVFRASESWKVRLAIGEDLYRRIQRFRVGRERAFDELPVASEFHCQGAYLAHRLGDLVEATWHQQEAVRLDQRFGRTLESLSHKRCLYCMQAELLTANTADLCPAFVQALDRIDEDMAALPASPVTVPERVAMRAVTALVQAKAAVFADALDVAGVRIEKARLLIGEIEEHEKTEAETGRYLWHDELNAMRACYQAVCLWASGREPEAVEALQVTHEWANRTRRYDYCFLHLPDKYREMLGSLGEKLPRFEARGRR